MFHFLIFHDNLFSQTSPWNISVHPFANMENLSRVLYATKTMNRWVLPLYKPGHTRKSIKDLWTDIYITVSRISFNKWNDIKVISSIQSQLFLSFAHRHYHSQYGLTETRWLQIESFSQYPALWLVTHPK